MRVEIDDRPIEGGGFTGKPGTELFYGIRLYPDTVVDVQDIERAFDLGLKPVGIERINSGMLHYLIVFE